MNFEKAQRATAKILIYSLAAWTNQLQTFSQEEKEQILNLVYNVLTNSMKPDMALIFNDSLFDLAGAIDLEKEEAINQIFDQLNWNKD